MILLPDTMLKGSVLSDCTLFTLRFMLFAIIHSLLASKWCKSLARRGSKKILAAYRLFYNLLSLGLLAWVMADTGCGRVLYFAPGVWSLAMYLLQIMVAAALFSCLRQTGIGNFIGLSQLHGGGDRQPQLIDDGWYAVVRHPLYLLSIIFLILSPVMTAQRALLMALSIPYFIIGGHLEERRLMEEFGERYRRYRQRVPLLIPWPTTSRRSRTT
jgi:protein-S-isoprenylcysteine O-methyltransferase Ste14